MLAVFQVGDREYHRVEVEQLLFGTRMTIKVDGNTVVEHRARIGWRSYCIPFHIGDDEHHDVEIHLNYITVKYEVYVDGEVFIGCLFPQAAGYNAFFLALFACLLASLAIFE